MNGTEIITLLSHGLEVMKSAVGPIAGALFTAIFLRHNTKASEFEKIKAGQFKEVADDLLKSGNMTYTEYYKANNFLAVAQKADRYYQEHPRKEEHRQYDFDWFFRFFEAAGNISDETMQNLWAKILAGEIAHPSTFSLRAIDVMRNLSKQDAELFIKVYSHSFMAGTTNVYLPNEDKYIESVGIQYTDIMKLNELGLIFNDADMVLNLNISSKPLLLAYTHDLIMLMTSTSGDCEKISIRAYPFTEVGKELSTMIHESVSEEDFLRYGQVLSHNKTYKISVHKVIKWNGKSVEEYDSTNLLIPEEIAAE